MYMYKQNLAINNLQWLKAKKKMQLNQTMEERQQMSSRLSDYLEYSNRS